MIFLKTSAMKTIISILFLLIYCLIFTVSGDEDISASHRDNSHESGETNGYMAECTAYCDVYGYYRPGKICYSATPPVYCCGNENYRYCCRDRNSSIDGIFPPAQSCPRSSWWLYNWRIILGILGSLMAVVLIAACSYYCCVTVFKNGSRLRAARRRTGAEVSTVSADIEQESRPRLQLMFDPESPYAFTPPAYDSLSKEPPKYTDIMEGQNNLGYESTENETMTSLPAQNDPPPRYDSQSDETNQREKKGQLNPLYK